MVGYSKDKNLLCKLKEDKYLRSVLEYKEGKEGRKKEIEEMG
jgi:hypothetical protein